MVSEALFPSTIFGSSKQNVQNIARLLDFLGENRDNWISLWTKLISLSNCPDEYLPFIGNNFGLSQGGMSSKDFRILLSSYYYRSNGSITDILSFFIQLFKAQNVFLENVYIVGAFFDGEGVFDAQGPLDPEDGNKASLLIKREDLTVPLSSIYNSVIDRLRAVGWKILLIDWFYVDWKTQGLSIFFDIKDSVIMDGTGFFDGLGPLDPDSLQEVLLSSLKIFLNDELVEEKPLILTVLPYSEQKFYVASLQKKNLSFDKLQWIGENGEILAEMKINSSQNLVDMYITIPNQI